MIIVLKKIASPLLKTFVVAMSTNGWMDTHVGQKTPSLPQYPEPRRSAPPIMQQAVSQTNEEVVWDDSMMDLDYFQETIPTSKLEPTPDPVVRELCPADIGLFISLLIFSNFWQTPHKSVSRLFIYAVLTICPPTMSLYTHQLYFHYSSSKLNG